MNQHSLIAGARYDFSELDVLVAEDNARMRRIFGTMLNGLGVETVRLAKSGNEALEILSAATPDLVLADWHMRPMDGLTLARNIRQSDDRIRFIPIIMAAGRVDQKEVTQSRDAGVNVLLLKPVSVSALAEKIAFLVEDETSFVAAPKYFGPDRRRRKKGYLPPDGERRKGLV